jgi:hypothetical protein
VNWQVLFLFARYCLLHFREFRTIFFHFYSPGLYLFPRCQFSVLFPVHGASQASGKILKMVSIQMVAGKRKTVVQLQTARSGTKAPHRKEEGIALVQTRHRRVAQILQ